MKGQPNHLPRETKLLGANGGSKHVILGYDKKGYTLGGSGRKSDRAGAILVDEISWPLAGTHFQGGGDDPIRIMFECLQYLENVHITSYEWPRHGRCVSMDTG